jgi:integrase
LPKALRKSNYKKLWAARFALRKRSRPRLAEFSKCFLESIKDRVRANRLAPSTFDANCGRAVRILTYFDKAASDIGPEHFDASHWQSFAEQQRLTKGSCEGTLRQYAVVLSQVREYCIGEGMKISDWKVFLETNPYRQKARAKMVHSVIQECVDKLAAAPFKDACALAMFILTNVLTGMRLDELLRLTPRMRQLLNGMPVFRIVGKGGRERLVPIAPELDMLLRVFHGQKPADERYFRQLSRFRQGSELFELKTSAVKTIKKVLGRTYGALIGRRFFATYLAKCGMKVEDLMLLMGHSTVDQTMTYICLDEEEVIKWFEEAAKYAPKSA